MYVPMNDSRLRDILSRIMDDSINDIALELYEAEKRIEDLEMEVEDVDDELENLRIDYDDLQEELRVLKEKMEE